MPLIALIDEDVNGHALTCKQIDTLHSTCSLFYVKSSYYGDGKGGYRMWNVNISDRRRSKIKHHVGEEKEGGYFSIQSMLAYLTDP